MLPSSRRLLNLLLLAAVSPACGCVGQPQNPQDSQDKSSFRFNAKLPQPSESAKVDPRAVKLTVTPLESTGPTKSQLLLIATVVDDEGQPRTGRKIEWQVEGVGTVDSVDETRHLASKGKKIDNRSAVSYTNTSRRTFKSADGREVPIQSGQTWCVITSAVEGDAQIVVTAPEIENADSRKAYATRHWCDGDWKFPGPSGCLAGGQSVLTTQLIRASDRQPLSNYKVRYQILDGPPTQLLPSHRLEAVVTSDANGDASITIGELDTRPGVTRIGIEVIRPEANGPGVIVGRGETTLEWQSAQLAITITAPPTAVVGHDVPLVFTVANPGRAPTQPVVVRAPVPQGTSFVASDPPAQLDGNQIVWNLSSIPGGGSQALKVSLRAPGAGVVSASATAVTRDGLKAEAQAMTRVATPYLRIGIEGPKSATPNDAIPLEVSISNTGAGPATNVKLWTQFDAALTHESNANPLEMALGTLEPGQTRAVKLTLTAVKAGKPTVKLVGTGDGSPRSEASHAIVVSQRALALSITGPPTRYVNRPSDWKVRVVNSGEAPLNGVQARIWLPQELAFQSATGGARVGGGEVLWTIGDMRPGESRDYVLATSPRQTAQQATITGAATADRLTEQRAEANCEILGMAALHAEIVPPVQAIPSGDKAIVTIRVTNTGTMPAKQVAVAGIVPAPFMKIRFATGPTIGHVSGDRAEFVAVDKIDPGRTVVFKLEVEGAQPGDGRARVELRSDLMQTPLIVEEAIRISPPIPAKAKTP